MRLICLLTLLTLEYSRSTSVSTVVGDVKSNMTLRCNSNGNVNWIIGPRSSRPDRENETRENGVLALIDLDEEDANKYICQDAESNESIHVFYVQIRTVPPQVTNLTVVPNTVFALITWQLPTLNTQSPAGNFSVIVPKVEKFLLRYRTEVKSDWAEVKPDWTEVELNSTTTSHTVFHLTPNSTYFFRVSAVNEVGEGKNVTALPVKTGSDPEEIKAASKDNTEDEEEDTEEEVWKLWLVGIAVMVVSFSVIGFGISLLLIKNCDQHLRRKTGNGSSCETTEEEAMELVPHITLNPSFNIDMLEYLEQDQQQQQLKPIVKVKKSSKSSPTHNILHNEEDDEDDDDELNLVNSPRKTLKT